MESAEVDPTPWEAYGRFTLFWKPFIGVTILETPWSGDWALVLSSLNFSATMVTITT